MRQHECLHQTWQLPSTGDRRFGWSGNRRRRNPRNFKWKFPIHRRGGLRTHGSVQRPGLGRPGLHWNFQGGIPPALPPATPPIPSPRSQNNKEAKIGAWVGGTAHSEQLGSHWTRPASEKFWAKPAGCPVSQYRTRFQKPWPLCPPLSSSKARQRWVWTPRSGGLAGESDSAPGIGAGRGEGGTALTPRGTDTGTRMTPASSLPHPGPGCGIRGTQQGQVHSAIKSFLGAEHLIGGSHIHLVFRERTPVRPRSRV